MNLTVFLLGKDVCCSGGETRRYEYTPKPDINKLGALSINRYYPTDKNKSQRLRAGFPIEFLTYVVVVFGAGCRN